jgi:hypothetical protein
LFFTFPTRALTSQQVISLARRRIPVIPMGRAEGLPYRLSTAIAELLGIVFILTPR